METYLEKMGRLIKVYESAIQVEVKMQTRAETASKDALESTRMRFNAAVAVDEHRKSITDYENNVEATA